MFFCTAFGVDPNRTVQARYSGCVGQLTMLGSVSQPLGETSNDAVREPAPEGINVSELGKMRLCLGAEITDIRNGLSQADFRATRGE